MSLVLVRDVEMTDVHLLLLSHVFLVVMAVMWSHLGLLLLVIKVLLPVVLRKHLME